MILFITRYFFCPYDGGIIILLILQCNQMKIYYFPKKKCVILIKPLADTSVQKIDKKYEHLFWN